MSGDGDGRKRRRQGAASTTTSTGTSTSAHSQAWKGNRYKGFAVPRAGWEPEVIDAKDVTPRQFFERYVATRTPVVLNGFEGLGDVFAGGAAHWADNHCAALREAVSPHTTVAVEVRSAAKDGRVVADEGAETTRFGEGRQVRMPFTEMLEAAVAGDCSRYMTTQACEEDDRGQPAVCGPPLAELHKAGGHFDLRPPLAGNLLPSNCNLWLGAAKHFATSGLHHDFHDNIYVLLSGRKRFLLFSPADAERMYVTGPLARVHENGRINYEEALTRADGADLQAAAQYEMLAAVSSAMEAGNEDEAESALEAALDAELDGMGSDDYDEDDDDEDEIIHDDFDRQEHGSDGRQDGGNKRRRLGNDSAEGSAPTQPVSGDVPPAQPQPENFSRVDPDTVVKEFAEFQNATPATCDVAKGQMLYLPAGWFHEVKSMSQGKNKFHMAFNFWFHPPDTDDFEQPYASQYWENEFAQRQCLE
eukprot:m.197722 g.197722  ORF g.197722 m.197722 type:complete len:474 (+) comp18354_c0_seq2:200-1621(+)